MGEPIRSGSALGKAPAAALPLLVRGVNWVGDAVMTTPALQRLRERFPEGHITLLTHEKLAGLWQTHPALDAVITFAATERPWSIARRLRAQNFQTALVLPNSPRSAFEVWAARIPNRIGLARSWRNWFLTRTVGDRPGRVIMRKLSAEEVRRRIRSGAPPQRTPSAAMDPGHQSYEYLHLAAALGANPEPLPTHLAVPTEETAQAAAKLGVHPERAFIGLNPGAEYGPAKRWPVERFAATARKLAARVDCDFLIFGGPADNAVAAELETGLGNYRSRAVNLAGRTSVRELCALLKLCRVLITNDTGPMHIAAALGIPVVVPFGSTSPELTAPGLPGDPAHRLLRSNAPCSPCFRRTCPVDLRCLNDISPEQVAGAALDVLAQAKGPTNRPDKRK